MILGIFTKIFARNSVDDVFAAVASRGLHAAHFNLASAGLPTLPDEIPSATLDLIHKAVVRHRVALAGISATFNLIHPDRTQRRVGLRRLEVLAAACPRLPVSLVTLCTGTRDPDDMWRAHPDNDSPEAWKDLLISLTKALTVADKHNLTLGIEPEIANVVSSARHARRLLDELRSPRLKIILDGANLFKKGDLRRMSEILEEAFDLLGPDLAMVHAKELALDGHAGDLPLGAGVLDWDLYFRLMRSIHFAGPLILHGFAEKDAQASVKFVRTKLEETRPHKR